MDISLLFSLSHLLPLSPFFLGFPQSRSRRRAIDGPRFCSERENGGGENPRSKFVKTAFSFESGNNGMPRCRRK